MIDTNMELRENNKILTNITGGVKINTYNKLQETKKGKI